MAKRTKTDRLLGSMREKRTPIANEMFLPNHSGDHVRSIKRDTPVTDVDLVNKAYVDAQIAAVSVTLDNVGNPGANKTFTMGNKTLIFTYTAPTGGDGAFEIEAKGGFSGDLVHIHQHIGNPSNVDLLHLEYDDVDVLGLRVNGTGELACFEKADGTDIVTINQTGIDCHSTKIINVVDPTANQDAATKKYVDDNESDTTDHTALSNIGTNTHAQIDTHVGLTSEHIDWTGNDAGVIDASNYVDNDTTDHTALSNIGLTTHAQIDTHVGLTNQHLDWTASVGTIHTGNYIEGGAGTDTTAIHDNVGSEISAITEKTLPIAADLIVIEDSAASNAKKRVQLSKAVRFLLSKQTSNLTLTSVNLATDATTISFVLDVGTWEICSNLEFVAGETGDGWRIDWAFTGTIGSTLRMQRNYNVDNNALNRVNSVTSYTQDFSNTADAEEVHNSIGKMLIIVSAGGTLTLRCAKLTDVANDTIFSINSWATAQRQI